MRAQGQQSFADQLARFAAGHADPRLTTVAERAAAPLRVAVQGRRGVGRSTVARALQGAAGISVRTAPTPPNSVADVDVLVHVTAEVVKPEDLDAIAAAGRPVLVVLNKADLAGSLSGRAGDAPQAAARKRCAQLSALVKAPMEPMIGLLAVAALDGLDGASWATLRTLADHRDGAACLDGSFDGFLAADNPVPRIERLRLLGALDLFGTALGIAAVRGGRTQPQVRALLRRISGVDAVLDGIAAAGAAARYQRVLDAVAELEALAVGPARLGEPISGFLCRDATVTARMAAALELADAAGLGAGAVGSERDDPAAHLPRALRWQGYSRGSASDLHRACGADIARGSLRLWARSGGSLPEGAW